MAVGFGCESITKRFVSYISLFLIGQAVFHVIAMWHGFSSVVLQQHALIHFDALFCKRKRLAFARSRAARCCGCATNHASTHKAPFEAYQNANRPHCTLIYASFVYTLISPNNERQMCMAFIPYLPQSLLPAPVTLMTLILLYTLSNNRMLAFSAIFGIIYGRTRCKLYRSRLRHVPKQSIPATIACIVGNVRMKKDGVDMV